MIRRQKISRPRIKKQIREINGATTEKDIQKRIKKTVQSHQKTDQSDQKMDQNNFDGAKNESMIDLRF